jgi:hypothetical protein
MVPNRWFAGAVPNHGFAGSSANKELKDVCMYACWESNRVCLLLPCVLEEKEVCWLLFCVYREVDEYFGLQ